MNELENSGLFTLDEEMPCGPKDIGIGRWMLPATLERAEREEAAARLIFFSQELDRWVGVSWIRLMEMMKADYELMLLYDKVQQHNWEERNRTRKAIRRYYAISVLTLGIYALFAKKPTAQLREKPEEALPFTITSLMGPGAVAKGVRELEEREMMRIEKVGEGDDAQDVIFPTPALILRIMAKQGVAPATA